MIREARAATLLAVSAALALGGCAGPTPAGFAAGAVANSPADRIITAHYRCGDVGPMVAVFTDGRVRITVAGRSYTLPRAISADGGRYTDGHTLFWDKGRTALLGMGSSPPVSCTRTGLSGR